MTRTGTVQRLPALPVPPRLVIDTNGAGDVFHGAYMASYLQYPDAPWRVHFECARAASAHKIQHLGNEAGLPGPTDVARASTGMFAGRLERHGPDTII